MTLLPTASPLAAQVFGGATSKWRPDIQGLRAVAVILVVVYHAHLLDGGFVGVDVFFVISGFLISAQLYSAPPDRPGQALLDFYQRRIRRILPASWLVLLLTVVVGWWVLNPLDWTELARDAGAAAFFGLNIRLAGNAVDYLRSDLPPSALQHYWSLAVEEQFYFVWPLIVLGVRRISERLLRPVLLGLIILSLGFMLFGDLDEPTRFYSLPTRAWQLLIGAFGAHLIHSSSSAVRQRGPWFGVVGMGAVGACAVIAGIDSTRWPGVTTIVLTLATLVIVLLPGKIVGTLLAFRPLTWIGDRSYSWYLLHFPPMIFLEVSIDDVSPWLLLASGAVTLALAHGLYQWFETPLRHVKIDRRRTLAVGVVGVVVLGSGFIVAGDRLVSLEGTEVAVAVGDGWLDSDELDVAALTATLPAGLRPGLLDARDDQPTVYDTGCHAGFDAEIAEPCVVHDGGGAIVALFGDSHAAQWVPALQSIAVDQGWKLLSVTKSGCTPADVETYNGSLKRGYTECTVWKRSAVEVLDDLNVDLVIVAGAGRYLGGPKDRAITLGEMEAGLTRTLRTFDEVAPVLYLEDTPYPLEDIPACLSDHPDDVSSCVATADAATPTFRSVERRAAQAANVPMVSTNDMLCGVVACPVIVGDVLVYRDGSHLTTVASEALAEPLLARLRTAGLPLLLDS